MFFKPLQTGQIWELKDSNLQIGQVGNLLVHYRHSKGSHKGASTSLSSKRDLERYLRVHKAILVQE